MKNWEKFEKEIRVIGLTNIAVVNGRVIHCDDVEKCNCCELSAYKDNCLAELINWLYSEADKPKVTKRARKLLGLVETGYIARDKGDVICWFKDKPYRYDTYWGMAAGDNNCFLDLKTINMEKEFSFITWEDEPWNVEDLLKLEVENEH